MKILSYNEFVNEKVYRLTGMYSSKGLIGKIIQAFKKRIESIKFEGSSKDTLSIVNEEWEKFKPTAHKMILDQVEKATKNNGVLFVTAHLSSWIKDKINKLNQDNSNVLYISLKDEIVINVGFMDDTNASKFKHKFDKESLTNPPLATKDDVIMGAFDSSIVDNNLELRSNEVMLIDSK